MTVQELKSAFVYAYTQEPDAIYFAPGRINLLGEYIDYNNDYEKPTVLSYGVYLLLRKNKAKSIKFWSLNEPEVISLDLNQLTNSLHKTWVEYPVNVFADFIKRGVDMNEGYDMLIWGNIPKEVKVMASDTLQAITAYALDDQLSTHFNQTTFTKIGQKAEHEFTFINYDIEKMPVFATAKKNDTLQLICNSLEINFLPIRMVGIKIIISNTHTPHELESALFNQRIAESKLVIEQLSKVRSLNSLSELTETEFKSIESVITNLVVLKRARHVVSEIQRTKAALKALKEGNLTLFGQLMNASHVSLRDNYEIVSPEVDFMVKKAWKIDGVIGSRMTGGGFGGCTVSLVKDEAINTFIERVGAAYESKTGIMPQFYIAKIGDCACKLK